MGKESGVVGKRNTFKGLQMIANNVRIKEKQA